MKKTIDREKMWLLSALVFVLVVALFWCAKKSDFFIDELYTYGLSNSYYEPFLTDVAEKELVAGRVFTRQDFLNYLTVDNEEEAFCFDSVYYNQTQDTQPPLHYFLLHFVCSIFQNCYSKWIGLSINVIIYIGTLLLLYNISMFLLRDRMYAALTVLIYGLSWGGLSTVLMIRMYMLLTFFSMCFTFFLVRLYQGEKKLYYYPAICLLLFLGLFTQYFFVIFAFFFSAVYCLRELYKRHFKDVASYAVSAFLGILIFYLSYPAVLSHLFADKLVSGKTAIENMLDYKGMLMSIYSFVMQTMASFKPALFLIVIALTVGLFFAKRIVREWIFKFDEKDSLMIAIAIVNMLTLIMIAIVSPVNALRYVYNILPLITLIMVYFMKVIYSNIERLRGKPQYHKYIFFMSALVCIGGALGREPQYVNNAPQKNYEVIKSYKELPCVYLDNNYHAPLTEDMLQLLEFEEIYMTNNFFNDETKQYLSKKDCSDGVILYIDISPRRSAYESEEILNNIKTQTGFYDCQLLFEDSFAETYLLMQM